MMTLGPKYRLPFLILGLISLLAGLATGLARLGISAPGIYQSVSGLHSAFMISAFFGTLIGLERAVATRYWWAYLAPLMSGLAGLLLLILTQGNSVAPLLLTIASAIFTLVSVMIVLKQPALFTITLWLAATLWFCGNCLWFWSNNLWGSIPFGLSFLVLTIAGERLELTRFMKPRPLARKLFIGLMLLITVGSVRSALSGFGENDLLGLGFAGLAIWLLNFDIARKTIRQAGITRFVAACLLSGYLWLLVGGILLTTMMNTSLGSYQLDAAIHSIALGFIVSMVIGHAPIIFPAIMRVAIPYSDRMYVPLVLLHLSVAIRFSGDLLADQTIRSLGGSLNVLAMAVFMLTIIYQAWSARAKSI
jgi:hypothetical protein